MLDDRHGIAVTSETARAVTYLDQAVLGLLAHRADTSQSLAAARAADPGMALGHILAGFLQLLLGRAELLPAARRAHDLALDCLAARGGTAREQGLAAALSDWCAGEMEASADRLDQVFAGNPHDTMTGKLSQALRFMLGDIAGMRRSVEAALPRWPEGALDRGFLLGWHAFTLEESGDLLAAERTGRQAVELEPADVWGCHAVVHVHAMRRDKAAGLAWLESQCGAWSGVNNFTRHLYWHQALLLLEAGRIEAVLDLYDNRIRDQETDDYRDIANAASLLRRLSGSGVALGTRWDELAELAASRIDDHALAFAQLHYVICLIGAARLDAAASQIDAMERTGRHGHGSQARILGEVAAPLARTALALAEDRAPSRRVSTLREQLARLGGSRVQRRIFERILDDAALSLATPRPAEIRGAA